LANNDHHSHPGHKTSHHRKWDKASYSTQAKHTHQNLENADHDHQDYQDSYLGTLWIGNQRITSCHRQCAGRRKVHEYCAGEQYPTGVASIRVYRPNTGLTVASNAWAIDWGIFTRAKVRPASKSGVRFFFSGLKVLIFLSNYPINMVSSG
jgi:hypothetical protein